MEMYQRYVYKVLYTKNQKKGTINGVSSQNTRCVPVRPSVYLVICDISACVS